MLNFIGGYMKKLLTFIILNSLIFGEIYLPYRGFLNGNYHLGFGTHFWEDHLVFRNGQLRVNFDLAPGIRLYSIMRSNKEFEGVDIWNPNMDELYIEASGFYENSLGKLSSSLKIGEMRYLRFPLPDIISQFDQVPGTEDLRYNDFETSYMGALLTLDFQSKLGLGYHFSGINWDYGSKNGKDIIENYLYYNQYFNYLDFESRIGSLQLRHPIGPASLRNEGPFRLGRSGQGFDIYLGTKFKDYKIGFLYEEIYDERYDYNDIRTGILVKFGESSVTEALGKVRFDYTRAPQGFGAHVTIKEEEFGYKESIDTSEYELIGESQNLRVTTYWQNGQSRNFYEHNISSWGKTSSIVEVEVSPWYLAIESLVSPHTDFSSKEALATWEKHRQGPAELNQKVFYKYYKKK